MRHFIFTRSAYGPQWDLSANRRRLDVTRAVTARLMAAQTDRDWTWVVLLDARDPLKEERQAVFAGAAPSFLAIEWTPPSHPQGATWDRHASTASMAQRVAAEAYRAPWRAATGASGEPLMMTRLDDDDGLAVDTLARYRVAAAKVTKRTILMLPAGVRVWSGRYSSVRHERNAMHCLVTMADDELSVYDYGHAKCQKIAPILMVDQSWGWLWVRHRDTISGWKRAEHRINPTVQASFPVDWRALGRLWR